MEFEPICLTVFHFKKSLGFFGIGLSPAATQLARIVL